MHKSSGIVRNKRPLAAERTITYVAADPTIFVQIMEAQSAVRMDALLEGFPFLSNTQTSEVVRKIILLRNWRQNYASFQMPNLKIIAPLNLKLTDANLPKVLLKLTSNQFCSFVTMHTILNTVPPHGLGRGYTRSAPGF